MAWVVVPERVGGCVRRYTSTANTPAAERAAARLADGQVLRVLWLLVLKAKVHDSVIEVVDFGVERA
jgi:hypothetical protein